VTQAAGRIVILACGGINADNVARLVRETAVREIHFSVKNAQKVRDVLESL
jgi:copper homeostasis protein CutC